MKTFIGGLFLALVMLSAPAHADVAPVTRSVYDCGTVSWSYNGKPQFRDEWVSVLDKVSAMSGIVFVEDDSEFTDILVNYDYLGHDVLGATQTYEDNDIIYYSDIYFSRTLDVVLKRHYHSGLSHLVKATMMHHLGLVLGLRPVKSDGDLMSEHMSPYLTRDDVKAFKSITTICDGSDDE